MVPFLQGMGLRIGVLIPCYNEALHIENVIKGVLQYAPEVIVVDDGSRDGTGDLAKQCGATVIRHPVNKGKGEALKTGFSLIREKIGWDAIITMDGDGQHAPEEIPRFIETAQRLKVDIVIGDRMSDPYSLKKMPLIRWLTNKVTSFIISRLTGQKIPDSQCGYRLINIEVVKNLELQTSRYDTESEILIESVGKGYKIASVPIRIIYKGETSYINPVRDTIRFIKLIYEVIFRN